MARKKTPTELREEARRMLVEAKKKLESAQTMNNREAGNQGN